MIVSRPRMLAGATLLLGASLLGACAQPARPRASAAATAACRVEADRVYSAQNRVDLSTRDQRDTPFASNYNSGITTRGLGAQFSRDNMVSSCLASSAGGSGAVDPGTGPTFTPTSR